MTLDEFFEGFEDSRPLFDALRAMADVIGPYTLRITRSQIAFVRARSFAWAWIPERHLHRDAAPLVLTLGFRRRDPSARWKEVVEPKPGRFTHHLELYATEEIDAEVFVWLRDAYDGAG